MEPACETFLERVLTDPTRPILDINQPPPDSKLYPTLEDLDDFHTHCSEMGAASIDVEACGPWPICVGCTAFSWEPPTIGRSICLRIRVRGGGRYWTAWKDHVRATQWLYDFLGDPLIDKVMHNGIGFDVPEFEDLGFKVEGRIVDTLMMVHAGYSELPKGLAFNCTLWLDVPYWKGLVDLDEDEEGKV